MTAFKKPRREVDRVFIHCSASDLKKHDDISVIRKWHTDPKPNGRGWSDVGYHYYINKEGILQSGRWLEKIPAAQYRHNTGTIAICLGGHKDFTQQQFDTLVELCQNILVELPHVTFHGHKEVAAKECPVFDYKSVLNLDKNGRMKPKPLPRKGGDMAKVTTDPKSKTGGILRHILTTLGGFVAGQGWLTAGDAELIAGALATVIGVVWSLVVKK